MNSAVKNQIMVELESLPEQKAYSLLDYLHFLKQEINEDKPNQATREAIEQLDRDRENLKGYASSSELFQDLGIDD